MKNIFTFDDLDGDFKKSIFILLYTVVQNGKKSKLFESEYINGFYEKELQVINFLLIHFKIHSLHI